ncbi:DUF1194 domain-containing protein [Pannonibacter sp. SL95]|uniref:DUF1194 domain-containing protein n=1 Tax=Pannonibacter sp. SL95 TaxID=2995153 RepID=UPI00227268E8|nr:DUF1194 domain-containing protein [Pannonibacter sp. SL95]MCY1707819.1 DUF1194 domain-containing protein [Pannonibacter sp. SL95]
MLATLVAGLLVLVGLVAAPKASAQVREEVDVALVLAVDISHSMDTDEQALQRSGYMTAITSPEVMSAIRSGLTGKIAVSYLEWAGSASQSILVDWQIIATPQDAENFASILGEAPIRRAYRTAIGDALLFSAQQFDTLPVAAMKKVIDISGDGPNNQGTFAPIARDEVVARGIVINGLPLKLKLRTDGWGDMENLDVYYQTCVIGGPGAFVIPVRGAERFAEAIRRKLVLEIAGTPPAPAASPGALRVQRVSTSIDPLCLEGERRWQQRNRNYEP